MQAHVKENVIREVLIWIQYFVISSLSSVWAHDYYLSKRYEPPEAGVDAIHLTSLLDDLWRGYFLPWLVAFLSLCALRFLFLFLSHRFDRVRKMESEGSPENRTL
jgi:hypothetical protein